MERSLLANNHSNLRESSGFISRPSRSKLSLGLVAVFFLSFVVFHHEVN
jgi:hypothetical protein